MELSAEIVNELLQKVNELLQKGEIKIEVSYRLVNEINDNMTTERDNNKKQLNSFTEDDDDENMREIVGLNELADYLNCSRSKAQSIVSRGNIPHSLTGTQYVFKSQDVDSALLKYKCKL